jgi:hypothetical protein
MVLYKSKREETEVVTAFAKKACQLDFHAYYYVLHILSAMHNKIRLSYYISNSELPSHCFTHVYEKKLYKTKLIIN